MNGASYDFMVDMSGVDRDELLARAAQQLDTFSKPLSGTDRGTAKAAEITRALQGDEARLPRANLDLFRITDEQFLARGLSAPVRFTTLSKDFNFYWTSIPIGLKPKFNWAFNRIEARIAFNEGEVATKLPKAYQILPAKQFQKLLEGNMQLDVRLNENFEFEAKAAMKAGAGENAAQGGASAGLAVNASAGAVLGPFRYSVKKAKIDHNDPGMEWVFWRIDGAEFFEESSPQLVVVLQVPKGTKRLKIEAKLQAYRYFNTGAADWRAAVAHLPEAIKGFFERGAPLADQNTWDLSEHL
jgi:hypothetical protein